MARRSSRAVLARVSWSNGRMKTPRGLDRLVAFSDAVVAIAITLIILPLVDTARDLNNETVGRWIHANTGSLAAAALSFAVIASFWITHHALFEQIEMYTREITWLTFLWLAGIVFLPLPTVLLVAGHSHDRGSAVLYISTMLVCDIALAGMETAAKRQELLKEGHDRRLGQRHWTPVVLMALALVLAACVPGVGDYALLVLLLSTPAAWISRRVDSRDRKQKGAAR